jgi:hypothetical protein
MSFRIDVKTTVVLIFMCARVKVSRQQAARKQHANPAKRPRGQSNSGRKK